MTKIMDFGELKVGVIENNHWMGVFGSTNNCKLPCHYNCTLLNGGILSNVQHEQTTFQILQAKLGFNDLCT
jgi:hypothetical protein